MSYAWRCESCHSLLGLLAAAQVRLKNKSELIIVRGKEFVVEKTCRRCGTTNEMRCPERE